MVRACVRGLPNNGLLSLCLFSGWAFLAVHAARSTLESSELDARAATAAKKNPSRRFLQVSDLHGDLDMAQLVLKDLKVLGEDGSWAGGDAILVQTGDIIDRGNHSKAIYDLFFKLQEEAPKSGGEVIMMLGNHEMMHLMGLTQYLSKQDRENFGGKAAYFKHYALDGYIGKRVSEMPAVVRVGEERGMTKPILFVHAGLLYRTAAQFIGTAAAGGPKYEGLTNKGDRMAMAINEMLYPLLIDEPKMYPSKIVRRTAEVLIGDAGPLWTRKLATGLRPCGQLQRVLSLMESTRMVVGHTVQEHNYKVNEKCHGRMLLTDTAISAAFTGTPHPSSVEYFPNGCSDVRYPKLGDPSATEIVHMPCAPGINEGPVE